MAKVDLQVVMSAYGEATVVSGIQKVRNEAMKANEAAGKAMMTPLEGLAKFEKQIAQERAAALRGQTATRANRGYVEQQTRDEMAARIKAMRAESLRSRIAEEVNTRLYGTPAQAAAAATRSAEAGVKAQAVVLSRAASYNMRAIRDMAAGGIRGRAGQVADDGSWIRQLKRQFGEESDFGNLMKMIRGAGPVAGIGVGVSMLGHTMSNAALAAKDFAEGATDGWTAVLRMGEGVPVLGSLVKGFHDAASAIAAFHNANAVEEIKKRQKAWDDYRKAVAEAAKRDKEQGDAFRTVMDRDFEESASPSEKRNRQRIQDLTELDGAIKKVNDEYGASIEMLQWLGRKGAVTQYGESQVRDIEQAASRLAQMRAARERVNQRGQTETSQLRDQEAAEWRERDRLAKTAVSRAMGAGREWLGTAFAQTKEGALGFVENVKAAAEQRAEAMKGAEKDLTRFRIEQLELQGDAASKMEAERLKILDEVKDKEAKLTAIFNNAELTSEQRMRAYHMLQQLPAEQERRLSQFGGPEPARLASGSGASPFLAGLASARLEQMRYGEAGDSKGAPQEQTAKNTSDLVKKTGESTKTLEQMLTELRQIASKMASAPLSITIGMGLI